MNEFFEALIPTANELPAPKLAALMTQAACLGILVAAVYYTTQRKTRAEAAPFVATLVLLCVLIAMVTQVIGSNLARAFSLAGALAIIRFRTVVDDTRDTAFVIAAVVMGMAVGADSVAVALAGLPVIAILAWGLSAWARPAHVKAGIKREPAKLMIRVANGIDPEAVLGETLTRRLEVHQLIEVDTARQGAALDLTYTALLRPDASAVMLVTELNKIEGVQSVEWRT